MKKLIRTFLPAIIPLVLTACNLFAPAAVAPGTAPVVRLTVQTQNGVTTFNQVGDVINYDYVITNTGSSPLAGPVIVTDDQKQVICPEIKTVGNGDMYLDFNETITCTSAYAITQSDVNTGSVTNIATAMVGGITSNQTGVTLTRGSPQPSGTLTLSKTASPQTYGQVGQTISYNFTITNTGATPLGPAQFVINDNKLGSSLACGQPDTTIAPNQPLNCTINYVITQADLGLANITNSATASGAGQTTAPVTAMITNLIGPATATPPVIPTATVNPSSNLAPGSTIQHNVAVGEWLFQIARCYGASIGDVRNANPQIANPNFILPSMTITVPRIGSAGPIYGPPCITFYTVQSGDTWNSIAQQHNACVAVLQEVNRVTLVAGTSIKVPRNSASLYCPGAPSVPVATANPGVTLTPTTTTTQQRITFPQGQNTASLVGVVNPGQTLQYVVAATQGQTLGITLNSDPNVIALGVNGPTGIALKTADGNFTWSTVITTGGDHYINLISRAGAGTPSTPYTLTVTLTSPTLATATATSTPNTPVP